MFRMTRTLIVAAAILAVAAPAASAKPLAIVQPVTSTASGYQGTYRPVTTNVALSPDRADKVGTLAQATNIYPIPVATTKTVTQSSFDWTSALIGAGFILSIVLVGAGTMGLRGRRRMALGV
jgi:hypothetical protein